MHVGELIILIRVCYYAELYNAIMSYSEVTGGLLLEF